jgi:lipopolysaccharide biosynthesis glycosyltransferase
MVTATDERYENYAPIMFKSFAKFNEGVELYCVEKNMSERMRESLGRIGVKLIEYNEPDGFDITNFSIRIAPYLQHIDYDKAMWMDVDAVVTGNISNLFDYREEFVAIPKHLGKTWEYLQDNGEPSIAMGTWIATKDAVNRMHDVAMASDTVLEGHIMRNNSKKFKMRVLDGETYACCREMTDRLVYEDGKLTFVKWGKKQFPKVIHFSNMNFNFKPSIGVCSQWVAANL